MKKIFFVVNDLKEFTFQEYIDKYLSEYEICIGTNIPQNPNEYIMIVLWDYRKIIPVDASYKNYIVFHGSNLPKGRGWAPIYYSFKEKSLYYTVTGIFADEKVDSGDVIIKARFSICDNYIADYVREWDKEIMVMLTAKILNKYPDGNIKGEKQVGVATYRDRRVETDNEVDIHERLIDLLPAIRGSEKKFPAFFQYGKQKYRLFIEPCEKPVFPNDLDIVFGNGDF
ncbi:MAG: formyltransferase family protein [Selenomonadaceae bacterium]